ncbi:MAG: cytochrome C, partial [Candidatus Zixiibacteriota bacterium]
MLKKPEAELCADCHKGKEFSQSHQHKPLKDGCFTCHDVHGSDNEHLLRQPGNQLCAGCHDFS